MTDSGSSSPVVAIRPAGPHALLIEAASLRSAQALYAEARRRQETGELPATAELVPGAATLLVDGVPDPVATARSVRGWRPTAVATVGQRTREVPTRYDGTDLEEVANFWGVRPDEVGALHAELSHEVAFIGFAPGFAYISGLPARLRVPRRSRPRTRVPTGSVGVAGDYTGVYPRDSPGGWQLIGRTATPMWDLSASRAAYLEPGDRVRFVPVSG